MVALSSSEERYRGHERPETIVERENREIRISTIVEGRQPLRTHKVIGNKTENWEEYQDI